MESYMEDIAIISLLSDNRKDICNSHSVQFPLLTQTKGVQLGLFYHRNKLSNFRNKWFSTVAVATSIQILSQIRLVSVQSGHEKAHLS
jgi:hypothetical protein